ncbi:MAG: LTA synthase family protein [Alphaproteobacteria bacterium]|nr:LTA synthase family protein [Alphaproteobacteria bacterium]
MKESFNNISSLIFFIISFICLFVLIQTKHIWGDVYIEQILVNLSDGITEVSDKLLSGYVISAVLGAVSAVACSFFIKKNRYLVSIGAFCLVFCLYEIGIFSYIFHKNIRTELYEKEYIFPQNLTYTFLNQKRNLVIVYLESMEENYAVSKNLSSNLIPHIYAEMKSNLSFEGFHQLPRQDFTAAAMVESLCAVPYKQSILKGSAAYQNFLAGLICYPEILEKNGYETVFMKGADIDFAKAKLFFSSHGFQSVMGKIELEQKYPSYPLEQNKGAFSGYSDDALYEMVKLELLNLSRSDKPFALGFITLDTHTPDYHLSRSCAGTSSDKEDIVRCADTMLAKFLNWLKEQPFYSNTTVVVLGDHIETGNNSLYPKEKNRKIVNFILNPSPVFNKKPHTAFTTLDIAPTVLNALGINFGSNGFGLGRSLLQENPTLLEKKGYKLETELLKSSKVYDSFETVKIKSDPSYHLYAPFGLELATSDDISRFATYSNDVLNISFLSELSFSLPQTQAKTLTVNLKFKTMIASKNKRRIKVVANGQIVDTIVVTNKDPQPVSKTILIPTSLLKENKLLLGFEDEDPITDSLPVGVLSLKLNP